jgi:hypothetical protein
MRLPPTSSPNDTGRQVGDVSSVLRYQPLLIVAAALAIGIVIDRYGWPEQLVVASRIVTLPLAALLWWLAAAAFVAAWSFVWRGGRTRRATWLLLIAVAMCGAAWHDLRW